MSKIPHISLCLLLSCSVTGISCRSGATRNSGGGEEESAGLSADEQDKRALAHFPQIFDIMQSSDRKKAVPKKETLYREIEDKNPKAVLSRESYWRS